MSPATVTRLQAPRKPARPRREFRPSTRPTDAVAAPAPLQAIAWGEEDRRLGEAICRKWLPASMPATPWEPPAPSAPISRRAASIAGWCLAGGTAILVLALLGAHHAH